MTENIALMWQKTQTTANHEKKKNNNLASNIQQVCKHEQQTGSKQEKEYVKAVYCHPAYLTCMQSTSWETLDWMKHKL